MNHTKDRLAQRAEIVRRLNGMDDTFFQKLAESQEVYEEMLRIILHNETITLTIAETQKYLRNCGSRSVILDVYGIDKQNRYYCTEMEKSDKHDHQRRVRYNLSNMDTLITEAGTDFKELPEIFAIYITKKDFLAVHETICQVNRVLRSHSQIPRSKLRGMT